MSNLFTQDDLEERINSRENKNMTNALRWYLSLSDETKEFVDLLCKQVVALKKDMHRSLYGNDGDAFSPFNVLEIVFIMIRDNYYLADRGSV